MNIKYKIVEVHDVEHSFVVRYYTDKISEKELATSWDYKGNITRARSDTNITIYNPDATPEEIDTLIQSFAPVQWFEMLERAKADISVPAMNHIRGLLNTECNLTPKLPDPPTQALPEISVAHIDALLERLKNA